MVVGLLAWLAWDVETDIALASQRGGLQGLEDEQWCAVRLLAALGPWLIEDATASTILEESVARTPRVRVVLDVRQGSDGGKVVMLAPDATDGERSSLASRVATLACFASLKR